MPQIQLIPSMKGVTKQELVDFIGKGWILAGRQVIMEKQTVFDPAKPSSPTGLVEYDVWVLPEVTVPAGMLASLLVTLYNRGADAMTLDQISRSLLNESIIELDKIVSGEETKEPVETEEILH